jgi:hypothetical protein
MAVKVVQITFSEEEYEFVNAEAQKQGLTIPILIKKMVLPKSLAVDLLDVLLGEINSLDSGEVFNIRKLFEDEWKKIDRGVRLSLGRTFYKMVINKGINNVEALDFKDSTGTQLYKKL